MEIPKIKFQLHNEPKQKKAKHKDFCYECRIRVNTFRNKGIEYQDGFLCSSCAAHHAQLIIEKRRKEQNG